MITGGGASTVEDVEGGREGGGRRITFQFTCLSRLRERRGGKPHQQDRQAGRPGSVGGRSSPRPALGRRGRAEGRKEGACR